MTYGMIFIGWSLVAIMLLGMLMIHTYRLQSNNKNANDLEKDIANMIVQRYYDSNFIGRVSMVLLFGTLVLSIIFFPFMYKDKNKK